MSHIVRFAQALDFAARKHVSQKRKGAREEPYVNHLAEVARMLAEATGGRDPDLVIAGLLHDTLEDTDTTSSELARHFGDDVCVLVREVTDNKRLPKKVRKHLQIETAPKKSRRAKMLKIADKTANLHSLIHSPPASWPLSRRREYLAWSDAVVEGCRGANHALEAQFDRAAKRLARMLKVRRGTATR